MTQIVATRKKPWTTRNISVVMVPPSLLVSPAKEGQRTLMIKTGNREVSPHNNKTYRGKITNTAFWLAHCSLRSCQKETEPVPETNSASGSTRYNSNCLLYTSDAADDLLCVD